MGASLANKVNRVSLNWPLSAQSKSAFFNRKGLHHELWQQPNRTVNDDAWSFNSQCSSQWDGMRHFGYQKEELFYNGVTLDQIHGVDAQGEKSTIIGIQGKLSSSVFLVYVLAL